MKKYLLAALCLISFSALRAQMVYDTFYSAHIRVIVIDSMYHDTLMCQGASSIRYNITVDTSFAGDTLRVVDTLLSWATMGSPFVNTTGAMPWTITTPTWHLTGSEELIPSTGGYFHAYMNPMKVTTLLDTLRYVIYHDSVWITPCLFGNITGQVYIDNNSNCVYDAGDAPLNGCKVTADEVLSSPMMPFWVRSALSSSSWYGIKALSSWMIGYTVSLPPSYAFIFPMSSCWAGPYFFTTLPQTGVDFPMQCTSNIDVQCDALMIPAVRAHTPFYMHPYVSNTGCDSASGTMTMVKDSRVIYNASLSTNPADTVRGDTLIWNYTNLTNLSAGSYWNSFMSSIHLAPDTTVNAGDTLCFRLYTNVPPGDINPLNNDRTFCKIVVYSYDPNSKEVTPAGIGTDGMLAASDSELTYTIHFQNTGTAPAYDVRIIDTLDSHLDPASLKILGTSHTMTPKWLAANVVEFGYKNIMLPDSTHDEPNSHGQVKFSIKLNAGLAPGTRIYNTGYIYFDLNPPVVTNTSLNTTPYTLHVPQTAANNITVYPNPATDQLVVEGANGEIFILNMSGSILMKHDATDSKTTIDVSRLPGGIYMLKAMKDGYTSTIKFTKY